MTPERRTRLLSLEEDDVVWRRVLAEAARELNRALIVPWSPHQEAVNLRVFNPRVGDYVYEVSCFRHEDWHRGIGFVQKITYSMRLGDVWHIRYGPDEVDVCRWSNCRFELIVVDAEAFRREVEALIVLPSDTRAVAKDAVASVGG